MGTSRRQRGAAVLLIVVGLLALVAMAGLAIDTGHLTLNKSRLQSTVDAAALAAAKVLDQTGSTAQADAAARATFDANVAQTPELQAARARVNLQVQFSSTLQPFAAGTLPANYVRVVATNFDMWTSFVAAVGVPRISTAASAVAGPSPALRQACNVAPMMVCGDPAPGVPNFGVPIDSLRVLKIGSNTPSPIGPGNFQLVRLPDANGNPQSGGSSIRENLAGEADGCATIEQTLQIDTQPGNLAGPVAQGLNTRFGDYSGGQVNSTENPPDVVTFPGRRVLQFDGNTGAITLDGATVSTASQIPAINHAAYNARVAAGNYDFQPRSSGGIGAFQRRELALPVGDCSGVNNGQTTIPVLGFACFFLLQPVQQGSGGGGGGSGGEVLGQFLGNCTTGGSPGPAPGNGPGPYVIQLYRDLGSADS
jgi:Flp pilus assembly protein TadG